MENDNSIKLFDSKKVRTHWDTLEEQWYFSVIDVVSILTDSSNSRDYWFKMKIRVVLEDGLTVKGHKNLKGLKTQNLQIWGISKVPQINNHHHHPQNQVNPTH
ncbi:MAG: hypothetical protein NTY07_11890 [Bacteroidia bacterium]|nr:hypothetical protein [Bacteroidia bacterium]